MLIELNKQRIKKYFLMKFYFGDATVYLNQQKNLNLEIMQFEEERQNIEKLTSEMWVTLTAPTYSEAQKEREKSDVYEF